MSQGWRFRSEDRRWWGLVGTTWVLVVWGLVAFGLLGLPGGALDLGIAIGISVLVAFRVYPRFSRAAVTVHNSGLVTVRNPFRTWTARSGTAYALVGWKSQKMPWLDNRYLALVWSGENGKASTIRLWAVGPDLGDRLAQALGLSAEPGSNVRVRPSTTRPGPRRPA